MQNFESISLLTSVGVPFTFCTADFGVAKIINKLTSAGKDLNYQIPLGSALIFFVDPSVLTLGVSTNLINRKFHKI